MSLIASWLASPPPDAAIEISPERVTAATVSSRSGNATVQAYAAEVLPPGAVGSSLTSQNILDRAAVVAALRTVLGRLGTRARRVALIIPDVAAKVSLVRFTQVPERAADFDQLVRWQLRKSAPFPIDDASVTYTRGLRHADGSSEFLVVLARRDVIREYETVCDAAGVYAGLVDLATLSVVNLFLASSQVTSGDWLIVHMRPDYTSIVIMRGEDVIFFRNRPEGEGDTLADLVHQTAMYYEDRLAGGGFARVLLGGTGRVPGAVDIARHSLEQRMGTAVEPIDPTRAAALTDRISISTDVMDILAPLVGIMLRSIRETVAA